MYIHHLRNTQSTTTQTPNEGPRMRTDKHFAHLTRANGAAVWRLRYSVLAAVDFLAEHPTPTSKWVSTPRSSKDVPASDPAVSARGLVASAMLVCINCASLKLRRLGNAWNDGGKRFSLGFFDSLEAPNLHLHRLSGNLEYFLGNL